MPVFWIFEGRLDDLYLWVIHSDRWPIKQASQSSIFVTQRPSVMPDQY